MLPLYSWMEWGINVWHMRLSSKRKNIHRFFCILNLTVWLECIFYVAAIFIDSFVSTDFWRKI